MPGFIGCRCCETVLVVTGESNGDVRLVNARSGYLKWINSISSSTLVDVALLSKTQVVAIDQTKRYLVDSSGVVSSITDTTGGGRDAHAKGLKVRNDKVYAIANPPYRANSSLSVEQTYSLTYGIAQDMTYVNDIAVDSSGNLYIVGQDVGNVSNPPQYGLRKFAPDGSNLWDVVKGDFSAQNLNIIAIDVDGSDNVYVSCSYLISGVTHDHIQKRSSSGAVLWDKDMSGSSIYARAIKYHNSMLYAWVQRSGSYVIDRYNASTGVLIDTLSNIYLGDLTGGFCFDPSSDDVIHGQNDSEVLRYDFATPGLKWTVGDTGAGGTVSIDANLF